MHTAWLARAWDATIVPIAQRAGQAALEIQSQGIFSVAHKDDQSPVTEADLAAHQSIMAGLRQATPTIPIVSEEGDAAAPYPPEGGIWWLVDPLDGTKEFVRQDGDWTVNIALVIEGVPVAGVVVAPAKGLTFYGQQGRGAYCINERHERMELGASSDDSAADDADLHVVASRSHLDDTTREFLDRLGAHRLVTAGSSLKFCRLAQGVADLYPRLTPSTMAWDTAAGHAVLAAAGGCVTDLAGTPLTYLDQKLRDPAFVAARSPVIHAKALALIGVDA